MDRLPPAPLAVLAAATCGVGELFRAAYRDWLPDGGRVTGSPVKWDLVGGGCAVLPTSGAPRDEYLADGRAPDGGRLPLPPVSHDAPPVDLGTIHLAGAGAIGEAFTLALLASGANAHLVPVDDQTVDLGNLQRYLLTDDNSVDESKVELVRRVCAGSRVTVSPVQTPWGADGRSKPHRDTVVVALDTAADRLGVAAGLHGRIYNAWTGPEDLGWSRHETFGDDEPCLACLYWPRGKALNDHERIAQRFGQHPLRIRHYLLPGVTVDAVMPPEPVQPTALLPLPPDAARWSQVPLLTDLVVTGQVPAGQRLRWAGRPLRDLVARRGLRRRAAYRSRAGVGRGLRPPRAPVRAGGSHARRAAGGRARRPPAGCPLPPDAGPDRRAPRLATRRRHPAVSPGSVHLPGPGVQVPVAAGRRTAANAGRMRPRRIERPSAHASGATRPAAARAHGRRRPGTEAGRAPRVRDRAA